MIGFKGFFSRSSEHPLARDEHVTTILADLPTQDPVASLQDLTHWLVLLASEDVLKNRAAKLFRIDQTGQGLERKLRHQYLEASRLHKAIEERLWNTGFEFLEATINAHFRCIAEYLSQGGGVKPADIAPLAVRAARRLDLQAHWFHLRYQPLPESLWERIYSLIKIAEEKELFRIPVVLNPSAGTETTLVQELLKFLMVTVADPRRLTKGQIALARQVTSGLAEDFVWEDIPGSTTVFHIDFSKRQPPSRLTQVSEKHFMARCFGPGNAVHKLVTGMKQVEQGAIPALLAGTDPATYRRGDLLQVLAHLAQSWSRAKPVSDHQQFDKRLFERKPFFIHLCVTHGFNRLHASLSRHAAPKEEPAPPRLEGVPYREQIDMQIFGFVTEKTREQQQRLQTLSLQPENEEQDSCETWIVQDISETGFGVQITTTTEDWVAPNVVVGLHYGTHEWQIGIVRRLASASVENTEVGIQILSKRPNAVMLRPADSQLSVWETSADTQTYHHTPGILLPPDPPLLTEECLLLAARSYDLHKVYELFANGQKRVVRLLDRLTAFGDIDQIIFADVPAKASGPRAPQIAP
jgi:hypothetical protein